MSREIVNREPEVVAEEQGSGCNVQRNRQYGIWSGSWRANPGCKSREITNMEPVRKTARKFRQGCGGSGRRNLVQIKLDQTHPPTPWGEKFGNIKVQADDWCDICGSCKTSRFVLGTFRQTRNLGFSICVNTKLKTLQLTSEHVNT